MLWLGLPERLFRVDLGYDRSRPAPRRFDLGDCLQSNVHLLLRRVENRGPIAWSDVVTLLLVCRRIVDLEEEFKESTIRQYLRIERDLHRFRMTMVSRVSRVRHFAADVADTRRHDALRAAK